MNKSSPGIATPDTEANNQTEKVFKKNKLIGFRSNTPWKKILAIIFYICIVLFYLLYFFSGKYDHTLFDILATKIGALLFAFIFLFPYCWASDIFSLKSKYKKATAGKIWRFFSIPCIVVLLMLFCIGVLESNKSEEYQAALQESREQATIADVDSTTEKTKTKSTTKPTTTTITQPSTTTKPTTTKPTTTTTTTTKQKEDVDSTKQITLMMMNEDIAKALSNSPSTVEFETMSWTFEKEGNTYTTGSIFECLNAFGVPEKHILIVVSEEYNNGKSVKAKRVYLDGIEVPAKNN